MYDFNLSLTTIDCVGTPINRQKLVFGSSDLFLDDDSDSKALDEYMLRTTGVHVGHHREVTKSESRAPGHEM